MRKQIAGYKMAMNVSQNRCKVNGNKISHSCWSRQFFELFLFAFARILSQLLLEGLPFLNFREFLLLYRYSLNLFLRLAYLHLVIQLLHEHYLGFPLAHVLLSRTLLFEIEIFLFGLRSPASLPTHRLYIYIPNWSRLIKQVIQMTIHAY